MAENSIIRPQTSDEKKDFKLAGAKTFDKYFRQKAIEEEQKHVKNHKPYCFRCAMYDFKDSVERMFKEAGRSFKQIDEKDLSIAEGHIKTLSKYGKEEMFEQVDIKEVTETKLIDYIKKPVVTGYNVFYKCKKRSCNITTFVPKDIYDKEYLGKEDAGKGDTKENKV